MILLDTSVLSLAFRRRGKGEAEPPMVGALRRMISADTPLAVPGIVLQELLSGVRTEEQFFRLKALVEAFPILMAEREDHLSASRLANACRRAGVSASTVDCLIASLAIERDAALMTLDADFARMARHCNLRLLKVERSKTP